MTLVYFKMAIPFFEGKNSVDQNICRGSHLPMLICLLQTSFLIVVVNSLIARKLIFLCLL